jgi:hypothetical protein
VYNPKCASPNARTICTITNTIKKHTHKHTPPRETATNGDGEEEAWSGSWMATT